MRLNEDINRGLFVFLTDAAGSYADHYKRMLVILMDGEITACLPQPLAAQRMLSGSNVFYYETEQLSPLMRDEIEQWFDRQRRLLMEKVWDRMNPQLNPFHGLTKRLQ